MSSTAPLSTPATPAASQLNAVGAEEENAAAQNLVAAPKPPDTLDRAASTQPASGPQPVTQSLPPETAETRAPTWICQVRNACRNVYDRIVLAYHIYSGKRGDVAEDCLKARIVGELVADKTFAQADVVAQRIAELHGKANYANEFNTLAPHLLEDDQATLTLFQNANKYIVLGEWRSPIAVMTGRRPTDEQFNKHIKPINERAAVVIRRLDGGEPLAQLIEGSASKRKTAIWHVIRDISAMRSRRDYRGDGTDADTRLCLSKIGAELAKNDGRPGRDPAVTAVIFDRYTRLIESNKLGDIQG